MGEALVEALGRVWAWRRRPDDLYKQPAFRELVSVSEALFPHSKGSFTLPSALSNALDRLGAPYTLPSTTSPPLSVAQAADRLERGFLMREAQQIHLCPLDLADDLPAWSFGGAEVRVFTADELLALIDPLAVDRLRPSWSFNADRFSQINWLVVRETVALEANVGKRALPWLFETLNRDFFKIEPHKERYPAPVERALFALLLAPWEDWTEHRELNWRAFTAPWVHTVSEDLFVSRHRLPSAETLNFELDVFEVDGETIELERRVRYQLGADASSVSALVGDDLVRRIEKAAASALFETPVAHFLVRAFAADGIDEFMGHLTMIEAALGQHESSATECVRRRLAGLLGDAAVAADYGELFELRSQFVHGRSMTTISGEHRCRARSLARRTAAALVERACDAMPSERAADLATLRTVGSAVLTPAKRKANAKTSSDGHEALDPALLRIVEALAQSDARRDFQENEEAAEESAALRSALNLEEDYPAWKARAEALMQAFYERVDFWNEFPLKARVRFVRRAVEENGPAASNDAIIDHAAELASREHAARTAPKPRHGRRPKR
ncbi:hypothetical protein [Caulobacter sp.]|nr:hypothetical protein [Caulobacter sp.]MBQ1562078.1 hypothetical protein [Caulobacter sp.]